MNRIETPDPMGAADGVPVSFDGVHGNRIAGTRWGQGEQTILLAHGGGQTRHSWDETGRRLAARGFTAIAYDHRGHGESDWDPDGRYDFLTFAADLHQIAGQVRARFGRRPVLVGASLGGLAGILAQGRAETRLLDAIILVDVTPRMEHAGIGKIMTFMAGRMDEGFASIEEAADAVAQYLPHRKRPNSASGLRKNLRQHPDGRFRWHWDPKFVAGPQAVHEDYGETENRLVAAASRLDLPVMLVRGRMSELVTEKQVAEFLQTVPHAKYEDVSGAGHMIAGDKNDVFADSVIGFIEGL